MKKLLALMVCALMLLIPLAGCSEAQFKEAVSGNDAEEAPAETTAAAELEAATEEDVQAALEDPDVVVVDTRNNSSYIGWTFENSPGGHIPGATDFAARWLTSTYSDKDNLEEESRETVLTQYMKNKHIGEDTPVILYDAGDGKAAEVAQYFADHGVKDIKLFNINDWTGELEKYPRYDILVPPEKVHALIAGEEVETFDPEAEYKIFDCSWGEVDNSGYLEGHVPGSVHVNTDWFEPEEIGWMLADDDVLLELMHKLGITAEDHIIVVGPEPMAVTRFATILRYMGVADVRVMSGGMIGWNDNGYELETENNPPQANDDFKAEAPVNPDVIDTQEEAAEMLESPDYQLLDNRTIEEWCAETSGYSYHDKAGRIPGTIFAYAGKKSSSSVSYYRNIDKTMRNADEIRKLWDYCGVDTDKHLSFFCGSGWRAAEIYWYASVMGMDNISLYSDGWIGWSNNGRPSETDEPEVRPVPDPEF